MFTGVKVGDIVVVCSGRPHFQKERRKVTYVDESRGIFEAANEVFDINTGQNRYAMRGAAFGTRTVHKAEGEPLQQAIRSEMIKRLSSLHVKDLKKVADSQLRLALESLGLKI